MVKELLFWNTIKKSVAVVAIPPHRHSCGSRNPLQRNKGIAGQARNDAVPSFPLYIRFLLSFIFFNFYSVLAMMWNRSLAAVFLYSLILLFLLFTMYSFCYFICFFCFWWLWVIVVIKFVNKTITFVIR